MQVFKAFCKIVKKRIPTVSIYFIVFIGMAIAMGNLGSDNEKQQFETTELNIAVKNQDDGQLGAALCDYLSEHNMVLDFPKTEDELLDAIYARELDYVLYIPTDFTEKFLNGEREALLKERTVPSSSSGEFGKNQVETYLTTVGMYTDSGVELTEALAAVSEDMMIEAEVELTQMGTGEEFGIGGIYFQYLPYIFICVIMCAVGPVFMSFNKTDINARNKASAMSFFTRNVQMILASLVVVLICLGLIIGVSVVIYSKYVLSVRGVFHTINALVQILFALAAAYTAAQFIHNEDAINMVSNLLGLALAFMGGIFVPLDIFSDSVLRVSHFMPTYWYIMANDAIQKMADWSDVTSIIPQSLMIQSVYCITVLAIGMLVNRMKART